jgi:hypothetical protein
MNRNMGWVALAATLAMSAACSQQQEASDAADSMTSDVSPTAAPGVAFDYRYRFGLPDAKITAAQEAHASACEKLGIDRCRIPGITGEDQNPRLDAAAAREVEAEGAANSIDTSLNETGQKFDRSVLREQARQARNAALQAREESAAVRSRLTSTPMHFSYEGGGAGRGFAGSNPVSEAWHLFIDSLATMIAVGLKALALVLPWLALLILAILAFRSRIGRRVRSWWAGATGERYGDGEVS